MQLETHVSWPLPAAELKPALELALALTRADSTVLLLHDDSLGALVPAVAYGISEEQAASIGAHRPGADADLFGRALVERRRVVVRDAWKSEPALSTLAQTLGFRSLEIVPLVGLDGQRVGELVMLFRHSHGTSGRMVKLVEDCARMVVCAVMQARRRAEAERARENTEQAGRAKIQFFARMSHELRTPLQSIAGYIDLLRCGGAEPLTPAQSQLLARVHDSEEVLVHVIDDLITFSRLEAGHVSYHIGPIAAEEALRIAMSVVAPLAVAHDVTLETSDCRDVFVDADGDKLKQILVNLAANAVKFCGNHGRVRITCTREEGTVRFDVGDDGPGIPNDRLHDIFEPYVQLATPLLDRFGGTGLGLAISREFALGMKGQISVASKVGLGSVFSLRLPAAATIGTRPAASTAATSATTATQPPAPPPA